MVEPRKVATIRVAVRSAATLGYCLASETSAATTNALPGKVPMPKDSTARATMKTDRLCARPITIALARLSTAPARMTARLPIISPIRPPMTHIIAMPRDESVARRRTKAVPWLS